ncbi:MAG: FprA family A-type flavoprotein [Clostridia bacterium]|nr:FprA family A-type flavoprotein [Clostridia bacterium]
MHISNDIKYVGVNDKKIDLFEGQYAVPLGISYNSYVILDEKIAVMDSVGEGFGEEWLGNIEAALSGRTPDYLVVQHMEPDHSASIALFTTKYPGAKLVASQKAFSMMRQFFGVDFSDKAIFVGEGDTLSLGRHTLRFITAPMVHWPEVIMSYDECDKVVFSADAFGKFGALDTEDEWACEARRYYIGIVGKYGVQVQGVLKKLSSLEIKTICPLHGPALSENIEYYINLYDTWSSYRPEDAGVLIAYASVYGNTRRAAELLRDRLVSLGCERVAICDLARDDMHEAFEDAFRYSALVLASVTYNGDIFPPMKSFIDGLIERNYRDRTVGFIENGSWAPMAAKKMRAMLEGAKDISYTNTSVKILSAISDANIKEIDALAGEIFDAL